MNKNALSKTFPKEKGCLGSLGSLIPSEKPQKGDEFTLQVWRNTTEKDSSDSHARARGRRCRSGGWGWACGGKQARPEAAWPAGGGGRSRAASSSSYGGGRPSDGFASLASASAAG